jgi:hypothetical protein
MLFPSFNIIQAFVRELHLLEIMGVLRLFFPNIVKNSF